MGGGMRKFYFPVDRGQRISRGTTGAQTDCSSLVTVGVGWGVPELRAGGLQPDM